MALQQYSYGFPLSVDTDLDLSSADSLELYIQRPSGSKVKRQLNSSVIVDGAEGKISYTVQEGDLSEEGDYTIQVADTTGDAFVLSRIIEFDVLRSIQSEPLG